MALAYAGLPAILALVPPDTIPDEAEVAINMPVLVFTLGIAILTSLVCGLAPALHSSRRDLATTMRAASRGVAGSSSQALLGKAFVVAQVALSLMLLVGASLLVRTFMAVQQVDLGLPAGSDPRAQDSAGGAAISRRVQTGRVLPRVCWTVCTACLE